MTVIVFSVGLLVGVFLGHAGAGPRVYVVAPEQGTITTLPDSEPDETFAEEGRKATHPLRRN